MIDIDKIDFEDSWDKAEPPDPLAFDSRNGWGIWVKWLGYVHEETGKKLTKEKALEMCKEEDDAHHYKDHVGFRPRRIFEARGWKCLDCRS